MKHRGEILEKAVRKSKIPITKMAIMFATSQRNMYNLFDTSEISNADMVRYGKILGVDFTKELPELIEYLKLIQNEDTSLNEDYKKKYYDLLEVYVKDSKEVMERLKALEDKVFKK